MSIRNHAPLRPTHDDTRYVARMWCLLVGLPCLALIAIACIASVAEATPQPTRYDGHKHIVFQCDRADEGIRAQCETFIIAAHPTLNEHHEATAAHRYEVELCDLSRRGFANHCEVWFVPKGDQIIAPDSRL